MEKSSPSLDQVTRDVTALFQSCRQSPEKPFEANGFLNFLFDPPTIAIGNSWKGARLKNRFFRLVEEHYNICFPGDACDRNWNFDKFCEWVAERAKKQKNNLKLAEKYRKKDAGCLLQIVLVTGFCAGLPFARGGFGIVIGMGILLLSIAVGWMLVSSYRHYGKVAKQLKG